MEFDNMRICVILEGCYTYVTGGVSSWMHQYIQAMPQHEFVVWALNADPSQNGKFRYKLPDNVVEVREVSLTDTLRGRRSGRPLRFDQEELKALRALVERVSILWISSPISAGKNIPTRLFRIFSTRCVPC